MKLFLIFHGRYPSEKAASLFAAKSAEAFAQKGLEVTLIVPERKGQIEQDSFEYYSVKRVFKIHYLSVIDSFSFLKGSAITFWLSYLSFSFACKKYISKNSSSEDIIYSNEITPLALCSKIRGNCFYEMHDFPESKIGIFGKYLSQMRWILIHNKWKLEEAKKLFPRIPHSKYLYEPNAVDLKDFDIRISKEEARRNLALPTDKKIVVYTGHLYGWKGVDTLAKCAQLLPNNYLVIFIGGTDTDIEKFRNKYEKTRTIKIVGHVKHSEIPIWQKAADILALPNTAKEKISAFYTSPMKLFEYMASTRPIVATNIPSIREILNENNSVIVEPDDPVAMKNGLVKIGESAELANRLSLRALSDVMLHTWEKRAERIIKFIGL